MYGPQRMLKKFKWPLRGKRFPTPAVEGQDPLYGAPVEVAEYPGVHIEPPQPAEEEELLSSFFGDGGGVKSPCQVLSDVDSEEPETADSLHRSPIDGDWGVSLSFVLLTLRWRLLSWHQDVRFSTSSLYAVSPPSVICDLADDGRVVSKLHDGVGAVYGRAVVS